MQAENTHRPMLALFFLAGFLGNGIASEKQTQANRIPALIRQLGDERYATRQAAEKQLLAIGEPALDAVEKMTTSTQDPEIRQRTLNLGKAIREQIGGKELAKLAGVWILESAEIRGEKVPILSERVEIKGASWKLISEDGDELDSILCAYKKNNSYYLERRLRNSHRIKQAERYSHFARYLFKLEGDRLILGQCANSMSKEPESFSSAYVRIVFKREVKGK